MIIPTLLLALKLVAHQGSVQFPGENGEIITRGVVLNITDCVYRVIPIWQDKRGIVPLPSALYTDGWGSYSFYSESPYVIIRFFYNGAPIAQDGVCPELEKTHK